MDENDVTNPHVAYFEKTQAPFWSVSFKKTFFKYIHLKVLMLIIFTFKDGLTFD